jgi:phage tail sheath protein FI
VYARTDLERGVWKAPAGVAIHGVTALTENIGAADAERLSRRGVNLLRHFPGRGALLWGARTTSSNSDWKYVSVRRFLIYLERSLERGLRWAVLEPAGEPLWAMVRAEIDNFLNTLWRSGALMETSREAYFVKCDRTTMTQDDIDSGRLVGMIGVAPLRPGEFVIVRIGIQTASPH